MYMAGAACRRRTTSILERGPHCKPQVWAVAAGPPRQLIYDPSTHPPSNPSWATGSIQVRYLTLTYADRDSRATRYPSLSGALPTVLRKTACLVSLFPVFSRYMRVSGPAHGRLAHAQQLPIRRQCKGTQFGHRHLASHAILLVPRPAPANRWRPVWKQTKTPRVPFTTSVSMYGQSVPMHVRGVHWRWPISIPPALERTLSVLYTTEAPTTAQKRLLLG